MSDGSNQLLESALRPPKTEGEAIVALLCARLDRAEAKLDLNPPLESGLPTTTSDPGAFEERIRTLDERVRRAETALERIPGTRLPKLQALFHLTEIDRSVLLTCLAPQLEPRLIARFARLTGRQWPTELLANLLFSEGEPKALSPSSGVFVWRLVHSVTRELGEPPALIADPAIRAWLAGSVAIEPELRGILTVAEPLAPLSGWPVEETSARVRDALERGERAVLTIEGLEGSGRATFAANVAKRLGQRCFVLTKEAFDSNWTEESTLRAHRFALIAGAVLVWRGTDEGRLWPREAWPAPVQAVTLETGEPAPTLHRFAGYSTSIPGMGEEERRELLDRLAPCAKGWSPLTRGALAARRTLTPAAIRRLGRVAPRTDSEALEVANECQESILGDLARRMRGQLTWEDLILPPRTKEDLADLAFECRSRGATWNKPDVKRVFSREAGLVALFSGSPGTGKTMSAQVIAHELGLDLYRIDCSSVISKYIGETAKNMRSIFARARRLDAVLFFDEADALFSKRTDVKDAHDRHANADTSYLLQLVEGDFDGVAILATNRMGDMDPAFLRRIRYVFEFPRPDEEQRREIWRRSAEALIPARAQENSSLWTLLGASLDFTGAQIKTTLLAAHFAAERREANVGAIDLVRAAERELKKEGRTLGQRERERILAHG